MMDIITTTYVVHSFFVPKNKTQSNFWKDAFLAESHFDCQTTVSQS